MSIYRRRSSIQSAQDNYPSFSTKSNAAATAAAAAINFHSNSRPSSSLSASAAATALKRASSSLSMYENSVAANAAKSLANGEKLPPPPPASTRRSSSSLGFLSSRSSGSFTENDRSNSFTRRLSLTSSKKTVPSFRNSTGTPERRMSMSERTLRPPSSQGRRPLSAQGITVSSPSSLRSETNSSSLSNKNKNKNITRSTSTTSKLSILTKKKSTKNKKDENLAYNDNIDTNNITNTTSISSLASTNSDINSSLGPPISAYISPSYTVSTLSADSERLNSIREEPEENFFSSKDIANAKQLAYSRSFFADNRPTSAASSSNASYIKKRNRVSFSDRSSIEYIHSANNPDHSKLPDFTQNHTIRRSASSLGCYRNTPKQTYIYEPKSSYQYIPSAHGLVKVLTPQKSSLTQRSSISNYQVSNPSAAAANKANRVSQLGSQKPLSRSNSRAETTALKRRVSVSGGISVAPKASNSTLNANSSINSKATTLKDNTRRPASAIGFSSIKENYTETTKSSIKKHSSVTTQSSSAKRLTINNTQAQDAVKKDLKSNSSPVKNIKDLQLSKSDSSTVSIQQSKTNIEVSNTLEVKSSVSTTYNTNDGTVSKAIHNKNTNSAESNTPNKSKKAIVPNINKNDNAVTKSSGKDNLVENLSNKNESSFIKQNNNQIEEKSSKKDHTSPSKTTEKNYSQSLDLNSYSEEILSKSSKSNIKNDSLPNNVSVSSLNNDFDTKLEVPSATFYSNSKDKEDLAQSILASEDSDAGSFFDADDNIDHMTKSSSNLSLSSRAISPATLNEDSPLKNINVDKELPMIPEKGRTRTNVKQVQGAINVSKDITQKNNNTISITKSIPNAEDKVSLANNSNSFSTPPLTADDQDSESASSTQLSTPKQYPSAASPDEGLPGIDEIISAGQFSLPTPSFVQGQEPGTIHTPLEKRFSESSSIYDDDYFGETSDADGSPLNKRLSLLDNLKEPPPPSISPSSRNSQRARSPSSSSTIAAIVTVSTSNDSLEQNKKLPLGLDSPTKKSNLSSKSTSSLTRSQKTIVRRTLHSATDPTASTTSSVTNNRPVTKNESKTQTGDKPITKKVVVEESSNQINSSKNGKSVEVPPRALSRKETKKKPSLAEMHAAAYEHVMRQRSNDQVIAQDDIKNFGGDTGSYLVRTNSDSSFKRERSTKRSGDNNFRLSSLRLKDKIANENYDFTSPPPVLNEYGLKAKKSHDSTGSSFRFAASYNGEESTPQSTNSFKRVSSKLGLGGKRQTKDFTSGNSKFKSRFADSDSDDDYTYKAEIPKHHDLGSHDKSFRSKTFDRTNSITSALFHPPSGNMSEFQKFQLERKQKKAEKAAKKAESSSHTSPSHLNNFKFSNDTHNNPNGNLSRRSTFKGHGWSLGRKKVHDEIDSESNYKKASAEAFPSNFKIPGGFKASSASTYAPSQREVSGSQMNSFKDQSSYSVPSSPSRLQNRILRNEISGNYSAASAMAGHFQSSNINPSVSQSNGSVSGANSVPSMRPTQPVSKDKKIKFKGIKKFLHMS